MGAGELVRTAWEIVDQVSDTLVISQWIQDGESTFATLGVVSIVVSMIWIAHLIYVSAGHTGRPRWLAGLSFLGLGTIPLLIQARARETSLNSQIALQIALTMQNVCESLPQLLIQLYALIVTVKPSDDLSLELFSICASIVAATLGMVDVYVFTTMPKCMTPDRVESPWIVWKYQWLLQPFFFVQLIWRAGSVVLFTLYFRAWVGVWFVWAMATRALLFSRRRRGVGDLLASDKKVHWFYTVIFPLLQVLGFGFNFNFQFGYVRSWLLSALEALVMLALCLTVAPTVSSLGPASLELWGPIDDHLWTIVAGMGACLVISAMMLVVLRERMQLELALVAKERRDRKAEKKAKKSNKAAPTTPSTGIAGQTELVTASSGEIDARPGRGEKPTRPIDSEAQTGPPADSAGPGAGAPDVSRKKVGFSNRGGARIRRMASYAALAPLRPQHLEVRDGATEAVEAEENTTDDPHVSDSPENSAMYSESCFDPTPGHGAANGGASSPSSSSSRRAPPDVAGTPSPNLGGTPPSLMAMASVVAFDPGFPAFDDGEITPPVPPTSASPDAPELFRAFTFAAFDPSRPRVVPEVTESVDVLSSDAGTDQESGQRRESQWSMASEDAFD